jgi:putative tricarboxylic transport membrane protein
VRLPDAVTGAAFAALGLAVAIHARGFPAEFGLAGPGLFPTLIGLAMTVAGLVVLTGGLRRGLATGGDNPWMRRPRAWAGVLVVPVGIGAYALGSPMLGAGLAGAALVMAMAMAWGRRAWEGALLGLGAAVLFHLVFAVLMRVPLPRGPLEALLP